MLEINRSNTPVGGEKRVPYKLDVYDTKVENLIRYIDEGVPRIVNLSHTEKVVLKQKLEAYVASNKDNKSKPVSRLVELAEKFISKYLKDA